MFYCSRQKSFVTSVIPALPNIFPNRFAFIATTHSALKLTEYVVLSSFPSSFVIPSARFRFPCKLNECLLDYVVSLSHFVPKCLNTSTELVH